MALMAMVSMAVSFTPFALTLFKPHPDANLADVVPYRWRGIEPRRQPAHHHAGISMICAGFSGWLGVAMSHVGPFTLRASPVWHFGTRLL